MFVGTYHDNPIKGFDTGLFFLVEYKGRRVKMTTSVISYTDSYLNLPLPEDELVDIASILWNAKSLCLPQFKTSSPAASLEYESTYAIGDDIEVKLTMGLLTHLTCSGFSLQLREEEIHWNACLGFSLEEAPFVGSFVYKLPSVETPPEPHPNAHLFKPVEDILASDPERYEWLKTKDFQVVTPENVEEVCHLLMNHDGPLAFDTETTGLDVNFYSKAHIGDSSALVGLVFATSPDQAFYIPLLHSMFPNVVDHDEIPAFMTTYIKPILETKPIIMYNASFDTKVAFTYDITPNILADVWLLWRTTEWHTMRFLPHVPHKGNKVSLKDMTYHYLHRHSLELEDFLPSYGKSQNHPTFADLPLEAVRLYACADGVNTFALYNRLHPLAQPYGAEKTQQIEYAFSRVIAHSEYMGLPVDARRIPDLRQELDQRLAALTEEFKQYYPAPINFRSAPQLKTALIDTLSYPVLSRTQKGAPSFSKDILDKYLEHRSPDGSYKYPAIRILKDIKEVYSVQTTFLKQAVAKSTLGGISFTSYDPLLETGRVSTSNPNVQSIPGFVKNYFISRSGYYTFNFDFSSVEYRLLANLAGEPSLFEFFEDPVKDYHRKQGSVLFGLPYSEVTSATRKMAKPLNFALPYGKGDCTLGGEIFGGESPWNTRRASVLRRRYFAEQPNIEAFFRKAKEDAVREPYFVQTFFGRRRYLDPYVLGEGNVRKGRGKALRASGNHIIQGTAADMFKMGIIRLMHRVSQLGWEGRVIVNAMVHDECNIEVHQTIAPWDFLKIVTESVCIPIPNWVPLYVGAGYGYSWGEAKYLDLSVGAQKKIMAYSGTPRHWDGDVSAWVSHCKELVKEAQVDYIKAYLSNPSHTGEIIDPDVLDFLFSVLGSPKDTPLPELLEAFSATYDFTPQCSPKPLVPSTVDFVEGIDREVIEGIWPSIKSQLGYVSSPPKMLNLLAGELEGAPDSVFQVFYGLIKEAFGIDLATESAPEETQGDTLDDEIFLPSVLSQGYYYSKHPEVLIGLFSEEVEQGVSPYYSPMGIPLAWVSPETSEAELSPHFIPHSALSIVQEVLRRG